MAMAAGFALDVAGFLTSIVLGVKGLGGDQNGASTSIKIIAGGGDSSTGGSIPHVALWDDNGNRIGQFHGHGEGDQISTNDERTINVPHSQTEPPNSQADPYYVMLSNLENNAICISAVYVSNGKISGSFYGDTGYLCGMSWFLSNNKIENTFITPRCVWLDADYTNGINSRALSFHLNDMAAQTDKIQEYQDNLDTLCKSTPRFSFWGNLLPDGIIPFFNPPLQYNPDSSGNGEGADVNPKKVIDADNQYDKGKYLKSRGNPRDEKKSTNQDKSRLIITDSPGHSARELCEHPNSYGWDTISTVEGLFCDMETKQLYALCSKTISSNCFDLEKEELNIFARRDGSLINTSAGYNSSTHWK